jgi:SPP1 gp7 family putative phage head morphogenesis protein
MWRFTKAQAHKHAEHTNLGTAHIDKATGGKRATLNKLRAFLDAEEPRTVKWLTSVWEAQGANITYKELREAFLNGYLSEKQIAKWQKDYSNLVKTQLAPQWHKAMDAAAAEIKARYPHYLYNPTMDAVRQYVKQHSAELITNLVNDQIDALNAMIQQAAYYDGMTTDELSRIIRPSIGLTKPQAKSNLNYYNTVKTSLLAAHPKMKEAAAQAKAQDAAIKYSARQHKYRAYSIARTELAYAYNNGAYAATKDAQARGYIGDTVKVWLTADDERVCEICGGIDGEKAAMDSAFSIGVLVPPAHPQCRCAVAYEEIHGNSIYFFLKLW